VSGAELTPPFAAMNEPLAPFQIADNLYYVGARDVTSYLIVTKDGLILLDGGFEQSAPQFLANVRTLGFDPKNIKFILNSHAHFDHAGGIAAIKSSTGAKFVASRQDQGILEAGGHNDFALHDAALFPPIKVDRVINDGERLTLGGTVLTAHITAGHTKGCTTWTMPVTIDGKRQQVLFLCSLTVLPQFRLVGDPNYPEQAADFEKSFATLRTLKCDVFLASHGSFFNLLAKRVKHLAGAKPNPFIDPVGCRAFFAQAEQNFDKRLKACKTDPACTKPED
jgi:metallo-beta-lactamase class B